MLLIYPAYNWKKEIDIKLACVLLNTYRPPQATSADNSALEQFPNPNEQTHQLPSLSALPSLPQRL